MIQELLYTSHEGRGLRKGSGGGFCTVLSTEGMAPNLALALEKLSGYKHPFDMHDPRSKSNPVNYRHAILRVGGKPYHVLSRISDYGKEHTGRTNKLAHHLVLPNSMLVPGGPGIILGGDLMRADWDAQVRLVPPVSGSRLDRSEIPTIPCANWGAVAGDAGWAGYVAEHLIQSRDTPIHVIFPVGLDSLPLINEVLSLLPGKRRWETTFSTYFTSLPAGISSQLRFVLDGTEEADRLRRDHRQLIIDLTGNLGVPTESNWVDLARTGQAKVDAPSSSITPSILPDQGEVYVVEDAPTEEIATTEALELAEPTPPPIVDGRNDSRSRPPLKEAREYVPLEVDSTETQNHGMTRYLLLAVVLLIFLGLVSGTAFVALSKFPLLAESKESNDTVDAVKNIATSDNKQSKEQQFDESKSNTDHESNLEKATDSDRLKQNDNSEDELDTKTPPDNLESALPSSDADESEARHSKAEIGGVPKNADSPQNGPDTASVKLVGKVEVEDPSESPMPNNIENRTPQSVLFEKTELPIGFSSHELDIKPVVDTEVDLSFLGIGVAYEQVREPNRVLIRSEEGEVIEFSVKKDGIIGYRLKGDPKKKGPFLDKLKWCTLQIDGKKEKRFIKLSPPITDVETTPPLSKSLRQACESYTLFPLQAKNTNLSIDISKVNSSEEKYSASNLLGANSSQPKAKIHFKSEPDLGNAARINVWAIPRQENTKEILIGYLELTKTDDAKFTAQWWWTPPNGEPIKRMSTAATKWKQVANRFLKSPKHFNAMSGMDLKIKIAGGEKTDASTQEKIDHYVHTTKFEGDELDDVLFSIAWQEIAGFDISKQAAEITLDRWERQILENLKIVFNNIEVNPPKHGITELVIFGHSKSP